MGALAGLKGGAAAAATRKRNRDKHRGEQQEKAVAQQDEKRRQREERLQNLASPQRAREQEPARGVYPMFPRTNVDIRTRVQLFPSSKSVSFCSYSPS